MLYPAELRARRAMGNSEIGSQRNPIAAQLLVTYCRAMRFALFLIPFMVVGCGDLGNIPSLAQRPIEKAGYGTPMPPTAPIIFARAGPVMAARIAALMEKVSRGDAEFTREYRASTNAITQGRRAAEGSETWITGETARSALEASRQMSADALAEIDQMLLAAFAGDGKGIAELSPAHEAALAVVKRQTERLDALSR